MINFTPVARVGLQGLGKNALKAAANSEATQRRVLARLLGKGAGTAWGKHCSMSASMSYEDFAKATPIVHYEDLRPWVMRMVGGEADVLWPGVCRRFAQSSGTSDGKSKYIPVTDASLRANHYPGASTAVALYLLNYKESHMFGGKGFILGGSFANELDLAPGVKVGDVSAHLIDCVNPMVNLFRVPGKDVALMPDWRQKLPALVDASIGEDITNISGVPSWFLTVLKSVMERAGASTIQQVWPRLEVFFHGGISFRPYRREYEAIAPGLRLWENYNASEGFFAAQCGKDSHAMMLLQDAGVFYELEPLDGSAPVPLWEAEQGRTYALLITAPNGLWRYSLGDTVTVESLSPLTITIAGRTKSFINAFGEEVMVHNTDAAVEKACEALGCSIANYTAAPVYTCGNRKGRHQWLIEWNSAPQSIEQFADELDKRLQQENSDYQAKRQGGIFLDRLEVVTVPRGLFDRWLASTGKLGGQRKVPRLSNDRRIADAMLAMAGLGDKQDTDNQH